MFDPPLGISLIHRPRRASASSIGSVVEGCTGRRRNRPICLHLSQLRATNAQSRRAPCWWETWPELAEVFVQRVSESRNSTALHTTYDFSRMLQISCLQSVGSTGVFALDSTTICSKNEIQKSQATASFLNLGKRLCTIMYGTIMNSARRFRR